MNYPDLEKKLERIKNLRLSGAYLRAFKESLDLAAAARRAGAPPIELEALWEAMDAGKTVCPQKTGFLEGLAQRAIRLAAGSPDPMHGLEARIRWGALLRALGRNGEAVDELRRALARPEARKDAQLAGFAYWNLGFALRMEAKILPARAAFKKALQIFQGIGDRSGEAFSFCGLAGATRLSGNPAASLQYYRRARSIFEREGDIYGKAYTRCGMGNALRRMRRWAEAVPLYNEAFKLYRRMGDGINEGYVLWGRSVCLERLGKSSAARADIRRAAAIFKRFHDERGMALLKVWHGEKFRAAPKALKEASLS